MVGRTSISSTRARLETPRGAAAARRSAGGADAGRLAAGGARTMSGTRTSASKVVCFDHAPQSPSFQP